MESHTFVAKSRKIVSILFLFGCCVLMFEYKLIHKFGNLEIKGPKIFQSMQERGKPVDYQGTIVHLPSDIPIYGTNGEEVETKEDTNRSAQLHFPELENINLDQFLSHDYNLSNERWLALMEARQRMRLQKINFFCEKYLIKKLTVAEFVRRKPLRHALYSNDQQKVIFGLVLKVASNHFKKAFKEFGGTKRLFLLPPEKCKNRLEKYFKVLFVRHPLARILSAYRDKFVDHHISHFVHIGRRIIAAERKGASTVEVNAGTDVTFPEFIKYITKGPTTRSNAHWDLIWYHNRVCELRYDFIGKLETIGDDFAYLIHKVSHGRLSASNFNLLKAYRSYHGDQEKLRTYYQNVSINLLKIWYDIYKRDFELFDYKMNILGPDIWPFH